MIWSFDPVAFSLFGLDVRWYGLAYIAGFFIALYLGRIIQLQILPNPHITKKHFENLTFWILLCGIIGGRLGHFLFYRPSVFITDIWEILKVWHGGMSIHGGIIMAIIFIYFWSRKEKISFFKILDIFVIPLALALFLGRIANFLNGELVGRPTNAEWGIIFPHIDQILRHPSQLYEAGKNLLLAGILWKLFQKKYSQYSGFLTTIFLGGYGIFRFLIEFFREPDGMFFIFSTGQILCLFMILLSILLALSTNFWHNGRK